MHSWAYIMHNLCFFHFWQLYLKNLNPMWLKFVSAFVLIVLCWICKIVYLACIIKYNYGWLDINYAWFMLFRVFVQMSFLTKNWFLRLIIFCSENIFHENFILPNFFQRRASLSKYSSMKWSKTCIDYKLL